MYVTLILWMCYGYMLHRYILHRYMLHGYMLHGCMLHRCMLHRYMLHMHTETKSVYKFNHNLKNKTKSLIQNLVKVSDSDYDVKKINQLEATINFTFGQLQCILASQWLIFLTS